MLWTSLNTIRRALAASLLLAIGVTLAHDLVVDGDYHWPVSIYPMYSGVVRADHTFVLMRAYGLNSDGTESLIADSPPLDVSRLAFAWRQMPAGLRPAVLDRIASKHGFPRAQLFLETWDATGSRVLARELIAESGRH